jgi:uncharacterized Tic20 family protein
MDNLDKKKYWGMEEKEFVMLIHFSQFAGFIVPFAGLILPIIMWQTNNKENELIDIHGKNIINWIISSTIYIIVSIILISVVVGIILLVIIGIIAIILPIIGGIKANNGEIWKYPLSIAFIK